MFVGRPKILVLGRSGMLGRAVYDFLSSQADCDVEATHRAEGASHLFLDVEEAPGAIAHILSEGAYHFVINCIGVLSGQCIRSDAAKMHRATTVNTVWPHLLAEHAASANVGVIHMSTDGVFSGDSSRPYRESCLLDSQDAYGQSKILGESFAPNVINIRCSIIGRDPIRKQGLVAWLEGLDDGCKIDGYHHHLWNGVTTHQFAQLCYSIILNRAFEQLREESPVHHFCPNAPITKYELLQLLAWVFKKRVNIRKVESEQGKLRRILATEYVQLKSIFSDCDSWEDVICEMDLNQSTEDS